MSGSRLLLALAQSRRGRHENKEKRSINKEYCSEMMENKSYRKGHNSVTRVQLRRSLECERNTVEGKETEKLRNKQGNMCEDSRLKGSRLKDNILKDGKSQMKLPSLSRNKQQAIDSFDGHNSIIKKCYVLNIEMNTGQTKPKVGPSKKQWKISAETHILDRIFAKM